MKLLLWKILVLVFLMSVLYGAGEWVSQQMGFELPLFIAGVIGGTVGYAIQDLIDESVET